MSGKNREDDSMKRIAWFSVLLVFFLYAGLITAQEATGPKIEIKELRYDAGKVVQGTPATHVFEVRNAGTEPLIIERVQTS
jgi:uncharacterized protein DUF1573